MPNLMKKKDWVQTVADVGAAEGFWHENISADGGYAPLPIAEIMHELHEGGRM